MEKKYYIVPKAMVESIDNDYDFLAGSPVEQLNATRDSGVNLQSLGDVTDGNGDDAAAKKNSLFYDEEW